MSQEEKNRIKHVSVEIKFRSVAGYASNEKYSTRHSMAPDPAIILRNATRELVRLAVLDGTDPADIVELVKEEANRIAAARAEWLAANGVAP